MTNRQTLDLHPAAAREQGRRWSSFPGARTSRLNLSGRHGLFPVEHSTAGPAEILMSIETRMEFGMSNSRLRQAGSCVLSTALCQNF